MRNKAILYVAILVMVLCLKVHTALAAERYISLAPSTTEILFALGLGDRVVGVSSYCDYPPGAKSRPLMGDFSHPNIERILSLKPDYVFCTGLEQAFAIQALKHFNIKVYEADPSNMAELYKTIADIGSITGKNTGLRVDSFNGTRR